MIRKATVTRAFYPMLCGSAFKHKGVQQLLDAVVDFLPAPSDRDAYKALDFKTGEEALRRPLDTDPLAMIAFKIMTFPHVGAVTFCRVYSGRLERGMALANTTRDKRERAGRMYLMHANKMDDIDEAFAAAYRRHRLDREGVGDPIHGGAGALGAPGDRGVRPSGFLPAAT